MDEVKVRRADRRDIAVLVEYRNRMFRDMEPRKDFSKLNSKFVRKACSGQRKPPVNPASRPSE